MKRSMKISMKIIAAVMIALAVAAGAGVSAEAAAKAPKSMKLKVTSKTIDVKGEATISVKSVSPSSASKAVTFKSGDAKVASVSKKGVVTGKKTGKTTITVTSKKNKKVKKTVQITVKNLKPKSLKVTSSLPVQIGGKRLISTKVTPAGVYCPLTFKSSDTSVATVDKNGKVTAKKLGTATITVSTSKKSGKVLKKTCKVKVSEDTVIITASDLKKRIAAKEKITLVDTRGIDKKTETAKGAITMHWKDISYSENNGGVQPGDKGFARTLSASAVSKKLSALGLGLNDQIVLFSAGYKSGGWGDDGRVAWQLIQCGYKNVHIVNGGFPAMKSAGIAVQTGPSAKKAKTVTVKAVDTVSHDITTEDLLKNYNDYKIIDVRAAQEYNGAVLYGEKSGGHLKGAIHIPFTDLFKKDGTLKSNQDLKKLFESKGIMKTDKVVTYCTGGIRSAYMQIVLESLGYEKSYNYAESVYRWSNTASAGTTAYWEK